MQEGEADLSSPISFRKHHFWSKLSFKVDWDRFQNWSFDRDFRILQNLTFYEPKTFDFGVSRFTTFCPLANRFKVQPLVNSPYQKIQLSKVSSGFKMFPFRWWNNSHHHREMLISSRPKFRTIRPPLENPLKIPLLNLRGYVNKISKNVDTHRLVLHPDFSDRKKISNESNTQHEHQFPFSYSSFWYFLAMSSLGKEWYMDFVSLSSHFHLNQIHKISSFSLTFDQLCKFWLLGILPLIQIMLIFFNWPFFVLFHTKNRRIRL